MANLYTTPTAFAITNGTPGAGLWLIDCQLTELGTPVSVISLIVTVGTRTLLGGPVSYNKALNIQTASYPVQVLAAAAEAITITASSSGSADTGVTLNEPTAVLQANNVVQWLSLIHI